MFPVNKCTETISIHNGVNQVFNNSAYLIVGEISPELPDRVDLLLLVDGSCVLGFDVDEELAGVAFVDFRSAGAINVPEPALDLSVADTQPFPVQCGQFGS